MSTFLRELRISIVATVVFALLCSGFYPVLIWGLGQILLPYHANGSLAESADGTVVGSDLIAQGFSGARYFHPRPSDAGTGYDPTSSGGSNLGPTSQKLIDTVKQNVAAYRRENGLADDVLVPADAVTASASGLDPHISPENARLQAPRVARERHLSPDAVKAAIEQATDRPLFGFIGGQPGVNVLRLNLALDGAAR
ncbi:MAG: K(+)-transporting ATPase subunit C [Verrucomicrobia bacterium]|nr:K(+)-transporting ATPase subunit C [Verrucomicrobiota bacterium]